MRDRDVRRASRFHRALYRLSGGLVGTRLVSNDILLLTTTGHLSGRPHTVPLLYLVDEGRYVVIASYGGRDQNPAWYHNLVDHPRVRIQIGRREFGARAIIADERQRAAIWPRVVAAYRGYAAYQSRTDRRIPVVFLWPFDQAKAGITSRAKSSKPAVS